VRKGGREGGREGREAGREAGREGGGGNKRQQDFDFIFGRKEGGKEGEREGRREIRRADACNIQSCTQHFSPPSIPPSFLSSLPQACVTTVTSAIEPFPSSRPTGSLRYCINREGRE